MNASPFDPSRPVGTVELEKNLGSGTAKVGKDRMLSGKIGDR